MSENDKNQQAKKSSGSTDAAKTTTENESLQSAFDEANEKGYFGTVPDETPNEAYTVQGVVKAAKEAAKNGK